MWNPAIQKLLRFIAVQFCLCCLVQVLPVTAQISAASDTTAKEQILELENRWLNAENDPAALESILAADFLHVVGAGIITKTEQLDYMKRHPHPHSDIQRHFEKMHVRIYGNVGIVNGEVAAVEKATTLRTLFTDIFALRDGKWQAVSAQELPMNTQ